jgi:hypothetical protein
MRIQHWQDAASLLLGVWLVLSPFVLGFAGAATWITSVGHTGDLVCSLGTNDRSRFRYLVARSPASLSQLRRVVA